MCLVTLLCVCVCVLTPYIHLQNNTNTHSTSAQFVFLILGRIFVLVHKHNKFQENKLTPRNEQTQSNTRRSYACNVRANMWHPQKCRHSFQDSESNLLHSESESAPTNQALAFLLLFLFYQVLVGRISRYWNKDKNIYK